VRAATPAGLQDAPIKLNSLNETKEKGASTPKQEKSETPKHTDSKLKTT
jgi:hypothetical protein